MRRILKLFCLFALCLVSVTPLWAETLTPAPLNPAFVEYQQQAMKAATSVETTHPTGRTPSPVDLSHLAGKSLLPTGKMATSTTFPESYDLREEGFVSPVRNQAPYGTCWTFAAMASMESTAMRLLGAESPDLAEWNLAYYGYVDENDELVGFGDYTAADFPSTANCGGDDFKATAILSRWTGPALESDDEYTTVPFPEGAPDAYHLSNVMFLYYDAHSRYAPVSIENLKYALMNYGAVSVGVGWFSYPNVSWDQYYQVNEGIPALYIPDENPEGFSVGSANHAVNIVGWDDDYSKDNFATDPGQNGAWIVRNSWGSDWGDEGYFYLSYYDAVLDTGAAYISVPADNFDHIYQHDPLGLCNMSNIPGDLTPSSAWMANVFTSDGVQTLKAVSLYAPAVDSTYEISVFTNVATDDPTEGDLTLYAQSGTLHEPGYRTVELDTPVLLSAGQKFSVVVKLNTPGYDYPIAIEYAMTGPSYNYSGKASAHPGESFFSADGIAWTDTTSVNSTANICLKAFTADIRLNPGEGGTLPDPGTPEQAQAAFDSFRADLDKISGDILASLGDGVLPGTLSIVGTSPVEFRCGNVPAPQTYPFEPATTRSGNTVEILLLLAYNHETGSYEIPAAMGGLASRTAYGSGEVTFTDDSPYDGRIDPDDGTLTDLRLMQVLVQAEVDESPAGSGGGCGLVTFAPAALLLLVPLTLLKKK